MPVAPPGVALDGALAVVGVVLPLAPLPLPRPNSQSVKLIFCVKCVLRAVPKKQSNKKKNKKNCGFLLCADLRTYTKQKLEKPKLEIRRKNQNLKKKSVAGHHLGSQRGGGAAAKGHKPQHDTPRLFLGALRQSHRARRAPFGHCTPNNEGGRRANGWGEEGG